MYFYSDRSVFAFVCPSDRWREEPAETLTAGEEESLIFTVFSCPAGVAVDFVGGVA